MGSAEGQLLSMVSAPPPDAKRRQLSALSTLAVGGAGCRLDVGCVPFNGAQGAAVCGLRPGLDVIHGPPGSGILRRICVCFAGW